MWVRPFAAQVHLTRLQHRRWIIQWERLGEVELVDGVAESLQVPLKSIAQRLPIMFTDATRRLHPPQLIHDLCGRSRQEVSGQLRVLAAPHSQIVKRLFSLDGDAVVAHYQGGRRGVAFAFHHFIVDPGQQPFRTCRCTHGSEQERAKIVHGGIENFLGLLPERGRR